MPYKRKYRKRRKYRKKRKRRKLSILRVPGLLIPDTTYVKLKYLHISLVLPTASLVQQVYSGSGLFNPGLGLDSGQPGGFPQWQAFYIRNQVISSSISIEILNLEANEAQVTLLPSNVIGASIVEVNMENRYCKNKILGRPSNARSIMKMYNKMGSRKIVGRSIDSVNYTGSISSNPADDWFWHIGFQGLEPANPPTTDLSFNMTVQITYVCKFFERRANVST